MFPLNVILCHRHLVAMDMTIAAENLQVTEEQ